MPTAKPPFTPDESLSVPLYEQITQYLKNAIVSGALPQGSLIESTRELSKRLGVSRHTVLHSMELLQSQGYLEARQGRQNTVAVRPDQNFAPPAGTPPGNDRPPSISAFGSRLIRLKSSENRDELLPHFQNPYDLPFKQWKRLANKCLQDERALINCARSDELRHELRDYLARSRSVICDPDQVFIYPDTLSALDSITRILAEEGSDIAVENPTRQRELLAFRWHNLEIYPLDVDDEGACAQQLETLLSPPRMVYVTPSHNNPLGTCMSMARRASLLAWAQRHDSFIVENDHMCHYRYTTKPMPSLQCLDPTKAKVIYLSSFESILDPLVRCAFVVVPKNMIQLFAACAHESPVPALDRIVLADFLKSGSLERHIHRSAQVLANKRRALAIALMKEFRRAVKIQSDSAGTYLAIRLETDDTEAGVIDAAQGAGLTLSSTASFYLMQNPPAKEFVVSFATTEEEEIEIRVNEFARRLSNHRP